MEMSNGQQLLVLERLAELFKYFDLELKVEGEIKNMKMYSVSTKEGIPVLANAITEFKHYTGFTGNRDVFTITPFEKSDNFEMIYYNILTAIFDEIENFKEEMYNNEGNE